MEYQELAVFFVDILFLQFHYVSFTVFQFFSTKLVGCTLVAALVTSAKQTLHDARRQHYVFWWVTQTALRASVVAVAVLEQLAGLHEF